MRSSTHHERTPSKRRHQFPWFRKSKSETDKELCPRRCPTFITETTTASSQAEQHSSLSSSTSSTAASGALHHRRDTVSSLSSHDIGTVARATASRPVKHVAVQCTLLTGEPAMTSQTGCDVTTSEKVSSGVCGEEMDAVYRGTSHQRRKAIAIAANDEESLLTQHPINYG